MIENSNGVNKNLFNFLSSFGMMLVGIFLLFVFSCGLSIKKNSEYVYFSISGERNIVGGDECLEVPSFAKPIIPLQKNKNVFESALTSKSIVAIDKNSGIVLFDKNSKEVRPLASITKLMSAMVLLELPRKWNEVIEILESDAVFNGSHTIEIGEKFTALDLWNAGLINSSNKSITALVRTSGVTYDGFVTLMNRKAKSIGLNSLHFVGPTGINEENIGNVTDIIKLLEEALKYGKIKESLGIAEYYLEPLGLDKKRRIWSTDWLVTKWIPHNFKEVVGKTGFIELSGYNFVSEITSKKGKKIMVIALGADVNENRFLEVKDLSEWIFSNYLWPGEIGYEDLVE